MGENLCQSVAKIPPHLSAVTPREEDLQNLRNSRAWLDCFMGMPQNRGYGCSKVA
jgi:hypothetical protein